MDIMTTKPCNVCGEEIEMRQGTDGKWYPTTGQRHVCPTKQPAGNPSYVNPVSSPNNPAPVSTDMKFQGKLNTIDQDKRSLTLKTPEGILVPFKWEAPLDVIMKRWQPGYYLSITHVGELLKSASYWQEGKDVFQKNQPRGFGGVGRSYTPRNENPIIYQVAYKEACETIRGIFTGKYVDAKEAQKAFDTMMDMAMERAKKDAKVLIQESGCQ
jgi:hypothetical protein